MELTPNIVIATDFEHKGKVMLDPYNDSVGIVCGTFAPLHKGHMRVIDQSRADNFITIVIVGGYDGDRGSERGMPLKERYKRLRCQYEDYGNVYIAMVDERRHKDFDEEAGLQEFHDSVNEILATYIANPRKEYVVKNYVGQRDYAKILSSSPNYSDHEIVIVDRENEDEDTFGMNATDINEDPFGHWNEIATAFKCFYRKCIILVGAESTGKSTMTRSLSAELSGSRSLEYGRVWTGGWRHRIESELNEEDYLAFIAGQLASNEDALYENSNAKIAVCDTDGFVTSAYLRCDSDGMNPNMVSSLFDVAHISRLWTDKHADAIIVMPNDVPFEMDGSRDGHLAEHRDEYLDVLLDTMKDSAYDLEDRIHVLSHGSFEEKLEACVKIISPMLQPKSASNKTQL